MTLSSWVAISAKVIRKTSAMPTPNISTLRAVFLRQAGGQRPHDDDIVAGHGQVADDDLAELGHARRR